MAQILVQVSEEMLRELERVAPGSSRKRSRFVLLAIQKALMELQDEKTKDAYRTWPDDGVASMGLAGWDEWSPTPPRTCQKSAAKRLRRTWNGR